MPGIAARQLLGMARLYDFAFIKTNGLSILVAALM
jgi:hypothetical protein